MTRVYFDGSGRPSGYGQSFTEAWFWNGSLIGMFLRVLLFVILLPLTIPLFIVGSRVRPEIKGLLIVGYIVLVLAVVLTFPDGPVDQQASGSVLEQIQENSDNPCALGQDGPVTDAVETWSGPYPQYTLTCSDGNSYPNFTFPLP